MSELEHPLEHGGALEDDPDAQVAQIEWTNSFKIGPASHRLTYRGPASHLPLIVFMAMVIIGALIWALASWPAGVTVIVAAFVLLFALRPRPTRFRL